MCVCMCLVFGVMQARAAELRHQKVEHEKAWAAAQRERELQKVRSRQQECLAFMCRRPVSHMLNADEVRLTSCRNGNN